MPQDITKDEDAAEKLPLLFRTVRGEKIPDARLDKQVKKMKEA